MKQNKLRCVKDIMTKTFPLLPDLTCPELAGYKLPPCSRGQEDGVDKLSISAFPLNEKTSWGRSYSYDNEQKRIGFKSGYRKAREKFEFTEADINNALSYGYHTAKDELNGIHSTGYGTRFIQSLRTPRTPIAIEVEMEYTCCNLHKNIKPNYVSVNMMKSIRPATHPDGTVKGIYIYE